MNGLAIRLEGVGKTYPFFDLDAVDLAVPTGTIAGLIGANGAGKSTTLRILVGLVRPDRGHVHVLGQDMSETPVAARRDLGFVSDDLRLYPSQTLAWHVDLVRSIVDRWDSAYAGRLLEAFDLKPQQRIRGLSHGQRVKALLLLALARKPRLLILDEPTAGLDPIARREVLGALAEVLMDEERTVLFSSQNTLDVEQISDQITFIDRGRLVTSTDKESLLDGWRSLRVRVPEGVELPSLPGVTRDGGSDRLPTLKSHPFDPGIVEALGASGVTVESVDRMTLEEIFVACVLRRRGANR